MPVASVLATLSITLSCLVAERGLARSAALRRITATPGDLARLLLGALLVGCVMAAATAALDARLARVPAGLIGLCGALAATYLLLHRHRANDLRAAATWLCSLLALALMAPLSLASDAQGWLIAGLGTAFALALGLPAFAALARDLDDSDVPARMRPLPVRVLAAAVVVLAVSGSLSW